MPTTTNFGWTTPADTDLVKDGAAAIRTLGSNIDTSLVDLNGGTTGQYLQKNSGTDLDFVWADVSAGGMTLISTTTLTGASVTLSSIPATFNDLCIVVRNFLPATDTAGLRIRLNADSNSNRHASKLYSEAGAEDQSFNSTSVLLSGLNDNAVTNSIHYIYIPDYKNTTTFKIADINSLTTNSTTTTNYNFQNRFAYYNQTTAISSLEFFPSSGNFTSGELLLYGVK
jgi:hypothetical protein